MSEIVQLNGGMSKVKFGCNANLDGYMTLMLDICKLYAIYEHLKPFTSWRH